MQPEKENDDDDDFSNDMANTNRGIDAELAAVKKSMEEAIRDGNATPNGVREQIKFRPLPAEARSPAAAATSELDRLNAPIEALYQQKRREIVDLQSRYHRDSAVLADSFRVRMADLEHEAHEALRALDRQFDADMGPQRVLLDRLSTMRE